MGMIGGGDKRSGVLRFLSRLASKPTPSDPLRAAHRWLKVSGDLTDRDVCLLVSYQPGGRVAPHALIQARAWSAHGYDVILVVVVDALDAFDPADDLDFCTGVLLRENVGYDFGAWASAIRMLPQLSDARTLAIANDSIYGPFAGFAELLERVRVASADLVGVIESHERRRHFQSFLLFFKRGALRSAAFAKFWREVRTAGRQGVIDQYELRLTDTLETAGLRSECLFPVDPGADPGSNPTLTSWRSLIERGFPFIKSQLLRDNPFGADLSDWQALIEARGYDPRVVEDHLARRGAATDPFQKT